MLDCEEFWRRLREPLGELFKCAPSVRCKGDLASPLVHFNEANQRHRVGLVDRQDLLERGALRRVVIELPVRLGEIHP